MARPTVNASPRGKRRSSAYGIAGRRAVIAARKAGREARRAASEVANSAEARRAVGQARKAVNALGKAAISATGLIRAALRIGSGRVQTYTKSREFRMLQAGAAKAASAAATAARAASASAGVRGINTWKHTVKDGQVLASRIGRGLRKSVRRRRKA